MAYKISYTIYFLFFINIYACSQNNLITPEQKTPVFVNSEQEHKAYFASGCFWCVEAIYESIVGVNNVVSGYSGGNIPNPTYEIVNNKITGHAETIEVSYDPKKINFSNLVDIYFASQEIEQINGQGPDNGPQYRSILFYQTEAQKDLINKKIENLEKNKNLKVAAEVSAFQKFWIAKNYHQDFKKKNPNYPYILRVSNPRFNKFKFNYKELTK
jgi:peptide-methionine (S)-S-oxide reductase